MSKVPAMEGDIYLTKQYENIEEKMNVSINNLTYLKK